MVATLERGDVDVIAVVEPFGTIARTTLDATLVTDMFAGEIEGFPVAGFYVTESFAQREPQHGRRLQPGVGRGGRLRQQQRGRRAGDPADLHRDGDRRERRELNYPLFVSGIDVEYLQTVPDYMLEAGLLDAPIEVGDHVVE